MSTKEALLKVLLRRKEQDKKWGEIPRYINGHKWINILGEEVGEVHEAILNEDIENLKDELIDVAAVAVAWVEEIDYVNKE